MQTNDLPLGYAQEPVGEVLPEMFLGSERDASQIVEGPDPLRRYPLFPEQRPVVRRSHRLAHRLSQADHLKCTEILFRHRLYLFFPEHPFPPR